ncbi:glycoside hydrolase family 18 protein [Kitasatospora sp. NPDC086801]|uniref:glycoside hydrolase family 18 protein n=1 Tax=Kitasatospora sp. NPDC086801 TaxID=3364066 RepID=UPI00381E0F2C
MEFVGYFTQWGIYGKKFFLKTIDDNGTAAKLTILNYAFENITSGDVKESDTYPEGYRGYSCFEEVRHAPDYEVRKADDAVNVADAGADYLTPFQNAGEQKPIGNDDPGWGAKQLMGNFNQLKKLKAKHKDLKVLVSLGGWSFSRNFSVAAKTPESRKALVSSCIDLFIKGNLPEKIWVQNYQDASDIRLKQEYGGTGAARGIFDGIDIDWEWPGCDKGLTGNTYDKDHDRANLVELLKEFRKQLDELDVHEYKPVGGRFLLTAFLPADPEIIKAGWDVQAIMDVLDFGNLQGYDYRGPFASPYITGHQSPLHAVKSDPVQPPLCVEDAVDAWAGDKGRNLHKLNLGIPYYARGWAGVENGSKDGLFKSAERPVEVGSQPDIKMYEKGIVSFKDLRAAYLEGSSYTRFEDLESGSAWLYSENKKVFWTVDDGPVVHNKAKYAKDRGMAGVMVYPLDGDDDGTGFLSTKIRNGLDGR